ncbi:MAG: DUF805 domain-containing protein [Neisseriaceae bacterium]
MLKNAFLYPFRYGITNRQEYWIVLCLTWLLGVLTSHIRELILPSLIPPFLLLPLKVLLSNMGSLLSSSKEAINYGSVHTLSNNLLMGDYNSILSKYFIIYAFFCLIWIYLTSVSTMLYVRRLHDIGWSAWCLILPCLLFSLAWILSFVPFIGGIISFLISGTVLLILGLIPSKLAANPYREKAMALNALNKGKVIV